MNFKKKHRSWYVVKFNMVIRLFMFIFLALLAGTVYDNLIADVIDGGHSRFPAFLLLWLFSAYIILPRIHRRLAKLYLPQYYIGRAGTGDGLLGDPINLGINGTKEQLVRAMERAGWTIADDLNFKSSIKMVIASVRRVSYQTAPVSSLFLLGKKQTLAYQQEVNGNPRMRHHVRFWKTPRHWWLPGGYQADWLGAATFDKNVGLSLFTGQITHKIDEKIDEERDFVVKSLIGSATNLRVHIIKHFGTGFHSRNGGGDNVVTDGAMPFITLNKK